MGTEEDEKMRRGGQKEGQKVKEARINIDESVSEWFGRPKGNGDSFTYSMHNMAADGSILQKTPTAIIRRRFLSTDSVV
jgi:hypothetical protein